MKRTKTLFQGSSPDTIIGENSICEGKLMSESSLRIEGQVYGDIECAEEVTISERGKVSSNIHARNIIVAGKIQGDCLAKERLLITRTGEIAGNISAPAIIIEEGAVFQGSCTMQGASQKEHVHPKLVDANKNNKSNQKPESKVANAN